MKRYAAPYKKYLGGAVLLNILSAVFNIFSFTLMIPILQILFQMDTNVYEFIPWESEMALKDIAMNNAYFYITQLIANIGPAMTLFVLGLFLGAMTLLKTSCYFGSSAVMIPLRTGIVRDIKGAGVQQDDEPAYGIFLPAEKGRHHSEDERRCGGNRKHYHEFS